MREENHAYFERLDRPKLRWEGTARRTTRMPRSTSSRRQSVRHWD